MFYNDLEQAATYISVHLGSPQAAAALIDDVEKAILDRLPYAESFEAYPSVIHRDYSSLHQNTYSFSLLNASSTFVFGSARFIRIA